MWNNIVGQEKVKKQLKKLYKRGKLAHAYLFYGNEGIGKDAVAIEFAKLINCENPVNVEEACDNCNSCQKISSFQSEYFHFICALPSGRSDQTDNDPIEKLSSSDFENYLEQICLKSKEPYYKIVLPNANKIRINSIRDIINKIYLTTSKHNQKVFIISEADKMTQEASNALLKILEEPPRNSILILTTSKSNALLATVAGRCQKIFFEPLIESQIHKKLSDLISSGDDSYNETEINLACKLAFGSISRAMELIRIGPKDLRNSAINFLVSTLTENGEETVSIIRKITENNNKDRTRIFLYILNIWFRDLLSSKFNGNISKIANFDLYDRLIKFNNNYPNTDIYGVILKLEESENYITKNVHLPLILTNLSFSLQDLIRKGT